MPFKAVFVSVVIGSALIVAAFMLNARRPGIGNPSLGPPFLGTRILHWLHEKVSPLIGTSGDPWS